MVLLTLIVTGCGPSAANADDTIVVLPSPSPTPQPTASPSASPTSGVEASLAIAPRLQWEANFGYCGEVALISAGLYYGQYLSQFDARAIASQSRDQAARSSQLLLGVNDASAARAMRLSFSTWTETDATDARDFLRWVKRNVVAGYPVTIGVYENLSQFDSSEDPGAGNATYDHIVPVLGIRSHYPLQDDTYHQDDEIIFSDNGLWSPSATPAFLYRYSFASFPKDRRQANRRSAGIYSLPSAAGNYGIAITGVADRDGVTLPVSIETDVNAEDPPIVQGSSRRPESGNVNLTVTVRGLKPGVRYNLYRYDSFNAVPDSAFNAGAAKAAKAWSILIPHGSTYAIQESISSARSAIYRAVPASAR